MALFRKSPKLPVVHAATDRRCFVQASRPQVQAHLPAYDHIMGPHVPASPIGVDGELGWTVLVMPARVHPWAFHNLTMWLIDSVDGGAAVLAVSAPCEEQAGYWLAPDPESSDWLSGFDHTGRPVTVLVPDNSWVWDDAVPHVSGVPMDVLARLGVPQRLWDTVPTATTETRLEDLADNHNPTLASTHKSRDRLRPYSDGFV